MQNNTIKKELSELTNEELVEIFKGQQTKFSTLKDEYQKTTLDLHESKLNLSESHNRLNETRLELQKSHSELKKAHDEIAELRYQLNYYLNEKYGTPSDSLPDTQDSTFDEPDNEEEIGSEQEDNKQVIVKSHTRNASNKPRGLPEDLLNSFRLCVRRSKKPKNLMDLQNEMTNKIISDILDLAFVTLSELLNVSSGHRVLSSWLLRSQTLLSVNIQSLTALNLDVKHEHIFFCKLDLFCSKNSNT